MKCKLKSRSKGYFSFIKKISLFHSPSPSSTYTQKPHRCNRNKTRTSLILMSETWIMKAWFEFFTHKKRSSLKQLQFPLLAWTNKDWHSGGSVVWRGGRGWRQNILDWSRKSFSSVWNGIFPHCLRKVSWGNEARASVREEF